MVLSFFSCLYGIDFSTFLSWVLLRKRFFGNIWNWSISEQWPCHFFDKELQHWQFSIAIYTLLLFILLQKKKSVKISGLKTLASSGPFYFFMFVWKWLIHLFIMIFAEEKILWTSVSSGPVIQLTRNSNTDNFQLNYLLCCDDYYRRKESVVISGF